MRIKTTLAAAVLLATAVGAGTTMHAQNTRKFRETVTVEGKSLDRYGDHRLTFSAPVALPGIALGPGSYVFRPLPGNVLQLTNAAGKPYSMFITIPTERDRNSDENEYSVVFGSPASAGSPPRIMALFTPGDRTGRQFVYSSR